MGTSTKENAGTWPLETISLRLWAMVVYSPDFSMYLLTVYANSESAACAFAVGALLGVEALRLDRWLCVVASKNLTGKESSMMNAMKNRVEDLLKTYHQRERKIAARKFELAHFTGVSELENITAMTYTRGDGVGRVPGHISNHTMHIALNYQEQTARMNNEAVQQISQEIAEMELEQRRLCYYVSLLEKRQAQVLELLYFESLTQEETAKSMEIAPRTVQELKKRAIDALVELYSDIPERKK